MKQTKRFLSALLKTVLLIAIAAFMAFFIPFLTQIHECVRYVLLGVVCLYLFWMFYKTRPKYYVFKVTIVRGDISSCVNGVIMFYAGVLDLKKLSEVVSQKHKARVISIDWIQRITKEDYVTFN